MDEQKRLTFTDNDDEILLRQVLVDLPFKAKYGQLNKNWQTVADRCCEIETFTWMSVGLSGQTARKRLDKLMNNITRDKESN